MNPRRRRPPPRGYLLVEVLVAGAMAAVVFAGLFTTMSQSRSKNVIASRDTVASTLALGRLEVCRSFGLQSTAAFTALDNKCGAASVETPPVPGVAGVYTRTTTVTSCTETVPAPGVALTCKDISVKVTYVDPLVGTFRQTQTGTRIYQP